MQYLSKMHYRKMNSEGENKTLNEMHKQQHKEQPVCWKKMLLSTNRRLFFGEQDLCLLRNNDSLKVE